MGGMLSQPVTDKREAQGEGLGLRYALSSMQGWRSEMEDAHDVKIGLKYGLEDWSYFAVFDGHAGKQAAAFASWYLIEFILRDESLELAERISILEVFEMPDLEKMHDTVRVENTKSEVIEEAKSKLREGANPTEVKSAYTPCTDQKSNVEPTSKTDDRRPSMDEDDSSQSSSSQGNSRSNGEAAPLSRRLATTPATVTTGATTSSPIPATTDAKSADVGELSEDEDSNLTQTDEGSMPTSSTFLKLPQPKQLKTVERAIISGFLEIDQHMRGEQSDMSGCTAICTLISPTHFFIANCGDSRAALFDGKVRFETEDHKPLNPKERRRIIRAGGCGTQRINGTLAVSRALGDFEFKKDPYRRPCDQLVSPEPEVTVILRNPGDKFLVLACDGIWDVMDTGELCSFIEYKLQVEPDLQKVCSSVLDLCLHKGSRDNMSIIIVTLENSPKFSEEERLRDLKNDEHLTDTIRRLGRKHEDFNEFLYGLKDSCLRGHLESEGFPWPPGGVEAKYDLIHDLFEKEFEEKSEPKVDVYYEED